MELHFSVRVRGGSDRTGAKFIDSYGEVFALAYSGVFNCELHLTFAP